MTGAHAALVHCLDHGLTFAAFAHGMDRHLWVQRSPALRHIPWNELDTAEELFIAMPFTGSMHGAWGLIPDVRLRLDDDLDPAELHSCHGPAAFTGDTPPGWDEPGYTAAITAAKRAIEQGRLEKVVLSHVLTDPFPSARVPELFLNAIRDMPQAFVCLLNAPQLGTWLGASPERLVFADGGTITTDSLAGTLPTAEAPDMAEQWPDKEQHEQDVVTRHIMDGLTRARLVEIKPGRTHVHRAGPVAHLRTTIEGRSGSSRLSEVVRVLHPTPAVCGTPTDAALEFIDTHEPHDRGLYTGSWGPWRVGGRTQQFVNLRCMRLFPGIASLFVGGGITRRSDPAREWAETAEKARTWRRPMAALQGRVS